MNKNGDSATMYQTIPAVAGLNRVEGFDPTSLLGRTVSPATGKEGLQLGLACKKLWFRLAYPKGRLQTERISITEQMAVFEARVYLDCSDANPVSSFVSGCTREDAPGGRYIQAAQNEAMDVALTDAGFGLQFADMHANCSTTGNGEKLIHPGAGGEVTEMGPVRNSGNAGTAVLPGNAGHTGNVVRPFPVAPSDGGAKKTPAQGAQPTGFRQPAHAAAAPQGQPAPARAGRLVQPAGKPQSQGGQPVGARQPVQPAGKPQGQGGQLVGIGQPVQAAMMPQGQKIQSAGTRQLVPSAALQGRTSPASGIGQLIPASAPQGQSEQPIGGGQGVMPAMPQKQEIQPAGDGLPVQTVMPQGQGMAPAGNKRPETPAMPQKQAAQPAGTRPMAQETEPASNGQPLQAAMLQGQIQPGRNGDMAQPAAPTSGTAGEPAPGGIRPGGTVTGRTVSGAQAAAQNPAMAGQGKATLPVGAMGDAQPTKGQRYFGNAKAAPTMPQNQPPHKPEAAQPAQPAAPQERPSQLPVPPASVEGRGTVQHGPDGVTSAMNSLPVPPIGKTIQAPAEAATATEDALPVPAGNPEKRDARSSVQEAMALLKGKALPAGTAESMVEGGDGATENAAGNTAAGPVEAASPESHLPVNGETAQGGPAPRYTPDMPVEEIVSLMTLEEAGKVVVDTGVSKGQTIAEVAERRPPSLKYYRYGGYKGTNNILRAAAQVMLDSMEGQRAS